MTISELDELFGTGHLGVTKDDRLGKCYEIAGYALTIGTAPENATLVHGSMHHLRAPQRINHAWLVLPSRMIWEPISTMLWAPLTWQYIVRPSTYVRYTQKEAQELIIERMHWGPWHKE